MKTLAGPILIAALIAHDPWPFIQETIDNLPLLVPPVECINIPLSCRATAAQPTEPGYWWVRESGWVSRPNNSSMWHSENFMVQAVVDRNNQLLVDTPWGTWYPVDSWRDHFENVYVTKVVEKNPMP